MSALFGHAAGVGSVALKVLLMFALAVVGFRFGERRTFAQLSPFDFAVSVALGAIIGRTATSDTTSFLTGAVAVLTLMLVHGLLTVLGRHDTLANVMDQPLNVLVIDGQLQSPALARTGLTSNDVSALLRQNGIGDLDEVQLCSTKPVEASPCTAPARRSGRSSATSSPTPVATGPTFPPPAETYAAAPRC